MPWRSSVHGILLLCSVCRLCRISGLWTFLTITFTLPSFSWKIPLQHVKSSALGRIQPQFRFLFHPVAIQHVADSNQLFAGRNRNRHLKSTWKATMNFRSKHHLESKAATHTPFWRNKFRTQLCLRGTGLKPRRRLSKECYASCDNNCEKTPCSLCWEPSAETKVGPNTTLAGQVWDEHYFFLGLEGQDCSEYYGTEDPRPYTEDGEFWHFEPKFDDFIDRWDTYDERCAEDDCCEDCIFALKVGNHS